MDFPAFDEVDALVVHDIADLLSEYIFIVGNG